MNQTQFIESSSYPELVRAVIEQVGGWDEFANRAQEIQRYGADGGVIGFSYYVDTVAFFSNNRAHILDLVRDMAQEFGLWQIEFVNGFNCLKDATEDEIGTTLFGGKPDTQVANGLAWFSLEEVSRAYCDALENL